MARAAHADNKRLNSAVVFAAYTLQHQASCTKDVIKNNALTPVAEWHAEDMINNRNINDDNGSDSSTQLDRANAAASARLPKRWRSTPRCQRAAWNWSARRHRGLVVDRRPHRVGDGSRNVLDVPVRPGGHPVLDGGVIDGLGDRRRDLPQVLHIGQ